MIGQRLILVIIFFSWFMYTDLQGSLPSAGLLKFRLMVLNLYFLSNIILI